MGGASCCLWWIQSTVTSERPQKHGSCAVASAFHCAVNFQQAAELRCTLWSRLHTTRAEATSTSPVSQLVFQPAHVPAHEVSRQNTPIPAWFCWLRNKRSGSTLDPFDNKVLPVFSCDSHCVLTKSNKRADDNLKCASFLLFQNNAEKLFDSLLEGTHLHLWKALTDLF